MIVHNVIAFSDRLSQMPEMKGVLAKLTTPEQAAEVFKRAKPKLAVYSHIVTKELQGKNVPPPLRSVFGLSRRPALADALFTQS